LAKAGRAVDLHVPAMVGAACATTVYGGVMARKTRAAPILTVHRGGADPVDEPRSAEAAELALEEAHDALMRMSLALPGSDQLRKSAVLLARSIRLRQSHARVQQRRLGPGRGENPDRPRERDEI
jgi:hypothetical protein